VVVVEWSGPSESGGPTSDYEGGGHAVRAAADWLVCGCKKKSSIFDYMPFIEGNR